MKARQLMKWGWSECCHLEYIGTPMGLPIAKCKQTGGECNKSCCKKYFVSNFRKHCEYLGRKEAYRFEMNRKY